MKMKRHVFLMVLILLVAGLFTPSACAKPTPTLSPTVAPKPAPSVVPAPSPAPKPATQPIKLKGVSFNPANNVRTIIYRELMDLIVSRSNGELAFEFLGGPEVIAATEQGQAIRKGVVDISMIGASALEGLIPEARLLSLSRLSPEDERRLGATDLMKRYFAKGGLYYLGRADPKMEPLNFTIFLMKKVAIPEDLKGIRCAAAGTYFDAAAKALGMVFSIIKTEDAYIALDRRMIDAFVYALDAGVSLSHHEVVKFCLDQAFYRSNTNFPIGLDKWNSLPEHLKKMINDTYVEFEPKLITAMSKGLIDARQKFVDKGVQFIKFTPEETEKLMDIVYRADAEGKMKEMPNTAPEFLKLVKAIK